MWSRSVAELTEQVTTLRPVPYTRGCKFVTTSFICLAAQKKSEKYQWAPSDRLFRKLTTHLDRSQTYGLYLYLLRRCLLQHR